MSKRAKKKPKLPKIVQLCAVPPDIYRPRVHDVQAGVLSVPISSYLPVVALALTEAGTVYPIYLERNDDFFGAKLVHGDPGDGLHKGSKPRLKPLRVGSPLL